MATIRSGDSSTILSVDAVSRAGRVTLYDAAGNPIDAGHPLAVYLTTPVGGLDVSLPGDDADLDSGAGTDAHGVIAIGVPGNGGHVVAGVAGTPLRTDPTGTTTQPVSGTLAVSNFPATQPVSGSVTADVSDKASRLLGHVTVDAAPNPDITDRASRLLGHVSVDAAPNPDVTDRASRLLGHVSVDNLPATQPVSGTVSVGNLPATQAVSGTVSVGNLPATQAVSDGGSSLTVDDGGGSLTVDGAVNATIVADSSMPVYLGSYVLPIEVVPTTLTDGTLFWALRNTGANRMFIRKLELVLGFSGTAAASRSLIGINRFSAATPTAGTVLTPIKKANTMPTPVADARYAPAGLTATGVAHEQHFYRTGVANQLAAGGACDLNFTDGSQEQSKFVLAPGEGLAIRAYGAVVLGFFAVGQVTWDERV